jgi:hypothetical protein
VYNRGIWSRKRENMKKGFMVVRAQSKNFFIKQIQECIMTRKELWKIRDLTRL